MGFVVSPSKFEIEFHRQIFAGQAYAAMHDGALPLTRFWREMEFRHDLNAARFDHYHRNIGMILEHDGNHVSDLMRNHDWTGCMREPTVSLCPIEPPRLSTQAIPEPPSFVMGVACVVAWIAAATILARRESRK